MVSIDTNSKNEPQNSLTYTIPVSEHQKCVCCFLLQWKADYFWKGKKKGRGRKREQGKEGKRILRVPTPTLSSSHLSHVPSSLPLIFLFHLFPLKSFDFTEPGNIQLALQGSFAPQKQRHDTCTYLLCNALFCFLIDSDKVSHGCTPV